MASSVPLHPPPPTPGEDGILIASTVDSIVDSANVLTMNQSQQQQHLLSHSQRGGAVKATFKLKSPVTHDVTAHAINSIATSNINSYTLSHHMYESSIDSTSSTGSSNHSAASSSSSSSSSSPSSNCDPPPRPPPRSTSITASAAHRSSNHQQQKQQPMTTNTATNCNGNNLLHHRPYTSKSMVNLSHCNSLNNCSIVGDEQESHHQQNHLNHHHHHHHNHHHNHNFHRQEQHQQPYTRLYHEAGGANNNCSQQSNQNKLHQQLSSSSSSLLPSAGVNNNSTLQASSDFFSSPDSSSNSSSNGNTSQGGDTCHRALSVTNNCGTLSLSSSYKKVKHTSSHNSVGRNCGQKCPDGCKVHSSNHNNNNNNTNHNNNNINNSSHQRIYHHKSNSNSNNTSFGSECSSSSIESAKSNQFTSNHFNSSNSHHHHHQQQQQQQQHHHLITSGIGSYLRRREASVPSLHHPSSTNNCSTNCTGNQHHHHNSNQLQLQQAQGQLQGGPQRNSISPLSLWSPGSSNLSKVKASSASAGSIDGILSDHSVCSNQCSDYYTGPGSGCSSIASTRGVNNSSSSLTSLINTPPESVASSSSSTSSASSFSNSCKCGSSNKCNLHHQQVNNNNNNHNNNNGNNNGSTSPCDAFSSLKNSFLSSGGTSSSVSSLGGASSSSSSSASSSSSSSPSVSPPSVSLVFTSNTKNVVPSSTKCGESINSYNQSGNCGLSGPLNGGSSCCSNSTCSSSTSKSNSSGSGITGSTAARIARSSKVSRPKKQHVIHLTPGSQMMSKLNCTTRESSDADECRNGREEIRVTSPLPPPLPPKNLHLTKPIVVSRMVTSTNNNNNTSNNITSSSNNNNNPSNSKCKHEGVEEQPSPSRATDRSGLLTSCGNASSSHWTIDSSVTSKFHPMANGSLSQLTNKCTTSATAATTTTATATAHDDPGQLLTQSTTAAVDDEVATTRTEVPFQGNCDLKEQIIITDLSMVTSGNVNCTSNLHSNGTMVTTSMDQVMSTMQLLSTGGCINSANASTGSDSKYNSMVNCITSAPTGVKNATGHGCKEGRVKQHHQKHHHQQQHHQPNVGSGNLNDDQSHVILRATMASSTASTGTPTVTGNIELPTGTRLVALDPSKKTKALGSEIKVIQKRALYQFYLKQRQSGEPTAGTVNTATTTSAAFNSNCNLTTSKQSVTGNECTADIVPAHKDTMDNSSNGDTNNADQPGAICNACSGHNEPTHCGHSKCSNCSGDIVIASDFMANNTFTPKSLATASTAATTKNGQLVTATPATVTNYSMSKCEEPLSATLSLVNHVNNSDTSFGNDKCNYLHDLGDIASANDTFSNINHQRQQHQHQQHLETQKVQPPSVVHREQSHQLQQQQQQQQQQQPVGGNGNHGQQSVVTTSNGSVSLASTVNDSTNGSNLEHSTANGTIELTTTCTGASGTGNNNSSSKKLPPPPPPPKPSKSTVLSILASRGELSAQISSSSPSPSLSPGSLSHSSVTSSSSGASSSPSSSSFSASPASNSSVCTLNNNNNSSTSELAKREKLLPPLPSPSSSFASDTPTADDFAHNRPHPTCVTRGDEITTLRPDEREKIKIKGPMSTLHGAPKPWKAVDEKCQSKIKNYLAPCASSKTGKGAETYSSLVDAVTSSSSSFTSTRSLAQVETLQPQEPVSPPPKKVIGKSYHSLYDGTNCTTECNLPYNSNSINNNGNSNTSNSHKTTGKVNASSIRRKIVDDINAAVVGVGGVSTTCGGASGSSCDVDACASDRKDEKSEKEQKDPTTSSKGETKASFGPAPSSIVPMTDPPNGQQEVRNFFFSLFPFFFFIFSLVFFFIAFLCFFPLTFFFFSYLPFLLISFSRLSLSSLSLSLSLSRFSLSPFSLPELICKK